ncbi:protein DEK-like isoform X4 [Oncorhynchus clarkii lewisi]|uniref:protein DEK-like isoform X4 n=1 Tax=Oncorhynchus clarkii lewisi TaxID=490388 RepID=UPI0039B863AD
MVDIRTAVRSESLNKSSDYEPVITLINKKHQPNETQCKNSQNITRHDSGLDDTSDDEPLTKLERLPRPKKATVQAKGQGTTYIKRGTGNGIQKTKNKIAGSTQDEDSYDSSDNEPLIKMVKQTSLPFKKRPFNTAREVNDVKSRNNVQNTQNICTESSDDSSEDEPLINLTRSPSKDTVRTILKSCVAKESKSNNCSERKGKTSREEEVNSDFDDEPLISLVKKPLKAVKKTTTPANKSVPGKTNKAVNRWSTNIVQSTSEGSLDDRLDDELLIKKMVRNPSMKTLMVILERCETKEALEDYYRANVGNACERSAEAMAEKRNRSQDCSDDEPLIKMVGNPES